MKLIVLIRIPCSLQQPIRFRKLFVQNKLVPSLKYLIYNHDNLIVQIDYNQGIKRI